MVPVNVETEIEIAYGSREVIDDTTAQPDES
jgi:hypothetical protein